MTIHAHGPMRADALLAAFDEHLRRSRGVCPDARRNYTRYVQAFLDRVFGEVPIDLAVLSPADVVDFVTAESSRYAPPTLQLVTTSLRSFFRFLRVGGMAGGRLDEAVPMVRSPRHGALPSHLGHLELAHVISSLDASSPRALRDRAMLLLVARLGLRASEVARLELDDLDWRSATVRVRTRKTGHGAMLPLTDEVGEAIAAYVQRGRPAGEARQIFLLHRQGVGTPIDRRVVGHAVRLALHAAGVEAPAHGANLLRRSLATDLLAHGASLKEIADLLGHRALASTQIYTKVDVEALREVSLSWPEVTL